MKTLVFSIFLTLFATGLFGQEIYFTKTGTVIFDSSTPLETIHAENNQVTSFLKTTNGELNFAALMKSFKFKNALMEEHFNENFIESSKYPKAVFKGQIQNWSAIDLSKEEAHEANVEGELTLHGVTKKISTKAVLHPQNGKIAGTCDFVVSAEDFDIKIPALVRDKIAKEVKVTVNVNYEPYNR
ncbi:YceI family protein [Mangrovibacterium sp.]|uniref:YceI family protein n=1 Tax=Mangrovibacterium sp. TaxID=1961364 RepID=UPI003561A480